MQHHSDFVAPNALHEGIFEDSAIVLSTTVFYEFHFCAWKGRLGQRKYCDPRTSAVGKATLNSHCVRTGTSP